MVNKSREGSDGGFETSDVLITVLTSAVLPVASRILTLAFGDNSLWSVDRLFIIYFASFSGWILRSYLQLVVERNGMRDKGYTFTLAFIISFNFALDRFRIKRFGRRK